MLQEYPTTRCSRRCHLSGLAIQPGDRYVSALVLMGDELVRIDVSENHWTKVPEGTVGWWKCKMPHRATTKLSPAPTGVLLDSLSELLRNVSQAKLSYLLALMLVRRRVLVETEFLELPGALTDSENLWRLTSPSCGRQWEVPIALPTSRQEAEKLQGELMNLLFTEE